LAADFFAAASFFLPERPKGENVVDLMEALRRSVGGAARVACRRCGRTLEIQKADAVRLAGPQAVWKDVGQRLLDNTCTQRTGRHEEDGCWPAFE
jgi:hypothetical protein